MSLRVYSLVFWMLGFIVLLEAGLEFRAHKRGFQTHMFGRPEARTSSRAPGAIAYGPTESFPFRSRVVPKVQPEGVTRIWIASASYAEDNDIAVQRIFPVLIDSTLLAQGWSVEVLNAARAGHVIRSNRDQLRELHGEWKPDVVLLYQMSLDINELSQLYLGGQQAPTVVVQTDALADNASVRDQVKRFFEKSTLYELVRRNLTNRVLEHRVTGKTASAAMQAEFRRRITGFVEDVRSLGAEPVLSTFAISHTDGSSVTRADRRFLLHNSVLHPSAWPGTVERWNDMIRELARELDVALIDVDADVSGQPQLFKDIVHFTPGGHRRVAESISRGLTTVLSARPDSRRIPPQP